MAEPKPNLKDISTHEFMRRTYKDFLREEFVFLFGIYCHEPSTMDLNTGNVSKSNSPDTSIVSKIQELGTYVTNILNLMDSRLCYINDPKECIKSSSHKTANNTSSHVKYDKKQSDMISVTSIKEDNKAVKSSSDLTVGRSDIEKNLLQGTEKEVNPVQINVENTKDNLNLETSSSIVENHSTSFNKISNKTLNDETLTTHLKNSLNRKRSKSEIDSQHFISKKKKLNCSSVNDSEMNTNDSAIINSGHADVSKYKILNNCIRNSKGETQLHSLCAKGKLDQIISILRAGFNPNVKDNAGWTPLHEAVKFGDLKIVKLLIEFGAFLNVPGFDYESPLHTAIKYEQFDVAKLLLQKGADSKCINIYGNNAQCLNENMWSKLLQFESPCEFENKNLPYEVDEICIYLHYVSLNSSIVNKFCQNFKVKSVTKFAFKKQLKKITHIVVPVDKNNSCDANFECLMGIANGICIVNHNWIVDSLEFGLLKASLDYEVSGTTSFADYNGPKKSRLNKQKLLPKLFDSINIHINGSIVENNFTVEQLKEIALEFGANILKRVPDPENCSSNIIPYHFQDNEQKRHVSTIILYCEDSRRLIKYNMSHVKTFSVPWFLEAVQKFHID